MLGAVITGKEIKKDWKPLGLWTLESYKDNTTDTARIILQIRKWTGSGQWGKSLLTLVSRKWQVGPPHLPLPDSQGHVPRGHMDCFSIPKVMFSMITWTAPQLGSSLGIHSLMGWDAERQLTASSDLRSRREVTWESCHLRRDWKELYDLSSKRGRPKWWGEKWGVQAII